MDVEITDIEIENIVSAITVHPYVELNKQIDLEKVAGIEGFEYEDKKVKYLIYDLEIDANGKPRKPPKYLMQAIMEEVKKTAGKISLRNKKRIKDARNILDVTAYIHKDGLIILKGGRFAGGIEVAAERTLEKLREGNIEVPEGVEIKLKKINLRYLSDTAPKRYVQDATGGERLEIEYNPRSFPGVVYRVVDRAKDANGKSRTPPREYSKKELSRMSKKEKLKAKEDRDNILRVAMLIFSSGKIICTGAKSPAAIDLAKERLIKKFEEVGMVIKEPPDVEVQNIVASSDIGHSVNLDFMAMECENTEYEPEQFPGLILRLRDPRTVMLIFRSGRMIITGAKDLSELKLAAQRTKDIVDEFGEDATISEEF